MAFAAFEVPGPDVPKGNQVLADDAVSRLTIVIKDGADFGLSKGSMLIFLEGDADKVHRAEDLFKDFAKRAKDEASIRARIKQEEDEAAGGVGFVFG